MSARLVAAFFAIALALFVPPAQAQDSSVVGEYRIHYSFDDGLEQDHVATLSADYRFTNRAGGLGSWTLEGSQLIITYVTRQAGHTVTLTARDCAVRCAGSIYEVGSGQTWTGRFTMERASAGVVK